MLRRKRHRKTNRGVSDADDAFLRYPKTRRKS